MLGVETDRSGSAEDTAARQAERDRAGPGPAARQAAGQAGRGCPLLPADRAGAGPARSTAAVHGQRARVLHAPSSVESG